MAIKGIVCVLTKMDYLYVNLGGDHGIWLSILANMTVKNQAHFCLDEHLSGIWVVVVRAVGHITIPCQKP